MAIKRNKRFHAEVATSALSDIMFFLLLFFLIISTLANPNVIKVPLPESEANEKTNKQHVTITITKEKKYFIDKKEVDFNSIAKELLAETKKINDETVIVRIPYDLMVQDLVEVLDIGLKNKLKFIIATKESV